MVVLAFVGLFRDGVGMYLRSTQRRNRDGSVVRYVQLAHNRRLVRSINRYLGEGDSGGDVPVGDGLSIAASRPMGVAWLLDGLWRQLGVDTALAKVLGGRRFTTDIERVLFALVANRAIDPASKLAAAEWASNDVAITGLESMDEDQAYRAMDLLVAAGAQAHRILALQTFEQTAQEGVGVRRAVV